MKRLPRDSAPLLPKFTKNYKVYQDYNPCFAYILLLTFDKPLVETPLFHFTSPPALFALWRPEAAAAGIAALLNRAPAAFNFVIFWRKKKKPNKMHVF